MNTFDFQGTSLRTIEIDGTPWFPATDVCKCLGLTTYAGTSQHLASLQNDERLRVSRKTHTNPEGLAFIGNTGSVNAVSESGLYKLILRAQPSRPQVAAFQDWVTREVLPAIRRTGGYLLNPHSPRSPPGLP